MTVFLLLLTMIFHLQTTSFKSGESIPEVHTCKGKNISPSLSWGTPPAGTKALALIMEDPDAPSGNWVHWVLYNLPPTTTQLLEGMPVQENLKDGSKQGINDFGKTGYGGPCPPPGSTHRYFFKLYALDTNLNLSAKATCNQLGDAMKGHILAETELVGKFQR